MTKTAVLLAVAALCCAAKPKTASTQTTVIFQPESTTGGPFPTNALTIPDESQLTGLRVNLPLIEDSCPLPNATANTNPVVCSNNALLNTLDGFSENPRLMVCFSGPVQPGTLTQGISLLPLNPPSTPIAINQVLYDPVTNCAYAKPVQVLAQSSTYLLAVTNAVLDNSGQPVAQSSDFAECLKSGDDYCESLESAVKQFGNKHAFVAASVFTTMTATAWLENARRFTDSFPTFAIPAGFPSSFPLSGIKKLTWNADQSGLPPQDIPLSVLQGVGQIAFGLYLSPNFLGQDGTITFGPSTAPLVPSSTKPPINAVSFHVLLPASAPPKGGYPVIVYGHGLGDNQFGATTFFAGKAAQNGFATLAIEVTGQGYGPFSTVTVTDTSGRNHTEATPGRGVLLPGNTTIGESDGCILVGTAIATRDCNLQTAVDLVAMVNTIRKGVLGLNLNANRIYYVGQSEGAIFGTIFHAVEPNVHTAVLSVGGGTTADIARYAISARPLADAYLARLGVLNVPYGAPPQPYFNDAFNDNYVYRDQAPVVNTVLGAVAVDAAFEAADWLQMLGDPLSFAGHLSIAPLPGVPAKSTLFLFSQGDLEVPNPANSALIRAAGGQDHSWYLLFQKAGEISKSGDLIDPHPLLSFPTIFTYPDQMSIALAEQQQVAAFFASDGKANADPNQYLTAPFVGQQLFVIPQTLPEDLNYFQLSPSNSVLP